MTIIKKPLAFGLSTGTGAVTALALSNPVGLVGGAIYGATSYLGALPIRYFSKKMFNTDNNQASLISKVVAYAATFFASAALGAKVVSGLGYPLTIGSACVLSIASAGLIWITSLALLGLLAVLSENSTDCL